MRRATPIVLLLAATAAFLAATIASGAGPEAGAVESFAVVQKVLQHPRCQNCHIPGDEPLQFDDGKVHSQNVVRGANGMGAKGLACNTCHETENPPASYGPNMPPGAPGWRLPSARHKMVFIGLSGAELCRHLKDTEENGGLDLAGLLRHVSEDKLILWGWDPGVGRAPVDVPHAELVAAFRKWVDGGAPCPAP